MARCLTLLTNCVLLWHTVYMQEVLQKPRAEGYLIDEAHFQYLSPSRYEHINRLGKYSFTTQPTWPRYTAARSAIPKPQ